ncbi:conserved protein of unknown function [Methanocaldococcus lauensis]|nr:conserved protein of unknown function [Methanocaldococcus lauensis]
MNILKLNGNKKQNYKLYWHIWYILFGILLILMFNLKPLYKTLIIGTLLIMILFKISLFFIRKNKNDEGDL